MELAGKLDGFDDFDKALGEFSERTEKNLVIAALRAGARVIIRHARNKVPEREGVLKKSFMTKAGRFRPGQVITLQVATKGTRRFAWYAHLVEFGTAKARARPFFRPAFEEHPHEIVDAIGKRLATSIPTAIRRGRR